MSRRIVFAGGMQTRALARIYRSEVAAAIGDDVVFIGTGAVNTDAARSTLLLADIVAMEIDEDGDAIPAASLPSQAQLVRIPNLYCDFLWPFAGRAHPRNRGAFALPGGPYPAEQGDRFLDQMAADGLDEDAAIARYLAMDIVHEGELDSRLTDRLAILRQLDHAGGYDLASYIADRFRTEPLFRTRQRVTMPLLRRLVAQLFGKLGVIAWQPDSLRRVPFPASAQPVHPGVAAHFRLTWVSPGKRYPVNEEGFFTFEEFSRRYLRFEWNEALQRGIQTAKTNPEAALTDLEAGLAKSPDSPLGRLAFAAARRAAGLDTSPADPAAIIDEDSYDPTFEAEPPAIAPQAEAASERPHETPVAAAPAEPKAAEAAAIDVPPEPPAPAVPPVAVEEPSASADYGATLEDALIAEAAPTVEPTPAVEAKIEPAPIAEAAPDPIVEAETPREPPPEPPKITRVKVPPRPANLTALPDSDIPAAKPGSVADGFTDFRPAAKPAAPEPALATPGNDLIDVLPRLLPVFSDLASAVDRPFGTMPEVMPPPPLRPILPPELQEDAPKQGLFARILGKK
jgi:hypothetical protein